MVYYIIQYLTIYVLKKKESFTNLLKLITLMFTIMLFSASSYASHCGGGHTHDDKKMVENKEVSIASNSEDEASGDEASDSDTETR